MVNYYFRKINKCLEKETNKLIKYIKSDIPFKSDIFKEIVIEDINK